ncbi:hypothetical protein Q5P01_002794 [Channa striata]|uniref:Uncharacterized protein n=1 Tax=Channa striata TaxID=64152 RepID=A0AA88NTE0_CHASR|nr:hypothetical protein Q5P01_002794 [Channa striata]
MEVKSESKPEKPPVLLILGLVCGLALISVLLICWFQKKKVVTHFRSNQPQTTNQNSAADQRLSREESQIYSTLVHGDVCIYETLRRPRATGNDEPAGGYSEVTSLPSHLKGGDDDSDACVYESPKHCRATGNDEPARDYCGVITLRSHVVDVHNSSTDDTDGSSDYCNVIPYSTTGL